MVTEVQRLREEEMRRLRPAVVRRWALALVFALISAAAAGSGYAWVARPHDAELDVLRSMMEFADRIERRVLTMTPTERRQFDALMRWSPSTKR